ncbi:MAG: glycosyltransferase [Dehalococcoidia bacterium]|jgi:glycosyltransferase involved in cell wall biosynthesis|nr:glycosyltransferase [Dehalococcoidia bacterium]HJN59260.1 glycosyltransferase [Dehalococcoidia bacterium]
MFRTLDIVFPVFNESKILKKSVETLHTFLSNRISIDWKIVIAENGSTDETLKIARFLSNNYSNVIVRSYEEPGRGRAVKDSWLLSNADLVSYMDVDLSTDLEALIVSLEHMNSDDFDILIGSRLLKDSKVYGRSFKRDFISKTYSLIFRIILGTKFKDAQCGFKIAKRESILDVLKNVKDNGWFFDTELLYKSEKSGLSIKEIPVIWRDDRDSKVKILSTIIKDLIGLLRIKFF